MNLAKMRIQEQKNKLNETSVAKEKKNEERSITTKPRF